METKRCFFCKKKTHILTQCKCTHNYCIEHRHPESHQCSFDHKKFQRDLLEKENPIVMKEKVVKV